MHYKDGPGNCNCIRVATGTGSAMSFYLYAAPHKCYLAHGGGIDMSSEFQGQKVAQYMM